MNLLKKILWYSDKQRYYLSKTNLKASIILFCSALSYAMVVLTSMIKDSSRTTNGINIYNYAVIVLFWALSGFLLSMYFYFEKSYKNEKIETLHNNTMMCYNIGFYVVLTYIYMKGAEDKVKPLMVFGIIIGIYTLCSYISPYILSLVYLIIYIFNFAYIYNYIGRAEAILGGIYILIYIFFIFVKSYSVRSNYEKSTELEMLNSYNHEKYIDQLNINSIIQKKNNR